MKKILCVLIIIASLGTSASGLFAQSIDHDLSKMSGIMAYSLLFEILINPEPYLGKTIKATGFFYRGYSEHTKRNFNYVMVGDETACCWQGLEFLIDGRENLPENYPTQNDDIEVIGVLKSYEAAGYTFFYLDVEEVRIL